MALGVTASRSPHTPHTHGQNIDRDREEGDKNTHGRTWEKDRNQEGGRTREGEGREDVREGQAGRARESYGRDRPKKHSHRQRVRKTD